MYDSNVQDVAADKVDKDSSSEKTSAPHLMVFRSASGDLEEGVIVSDGCRIFTAASDIHEAVLLLIAAYYMADFSYTKVYCNMLSILQQHAVGEAYVGDRSATASHSLRNL